MKHFFLTTVGILFFFSHSFSQDFITKRSGEIIKAKVTQKLPKEVKFKLYDELQGPIFSILHSDISIIVFEDGSSKVYNMDYASENANFSHRGQVDAMNYYRGYKAAGTGTLLIGLFSPLVGLVPAIACSSSSPKMSTLSYPDSELIKDPYYYDGYNKRAKKIKQGRVWRNWGIAFGVNIAAVLILSSGG